MAIKDNTIIGGNLQYEHAKHPGSNDYSSYGAGLFVRKYRPLGKGFYLFGEGDLDFNYNRHTQTYISTQAVQVQENTNYRIGLGFNPGISYEISRRFHLELILADFIRAYYTWGETEVVTPPYSYNKKNTFALHSNISLNGINSIAIGIRFLLRKQKSDFE